MQQEPVIAELAALLPASLATGRLSIEPCPTGGNNRVYLLVAADRKFVAKYYYRDPSDTRDRLKSEYAFLIYARRIGIREVPNPIACDADRGIGIYDYIQGRKLSPGEIDECCVDQAADFFLRLNHPSTISHASGLPAASEACFSIVDHLAMVDTRIDRLQGIPARLNVDIEAREFASLLRERWTQTKSDVQKGARRLGTDPAAAIAPRCVSPSDFGFHNALASIDRRIHFIDFEYAGWDDPAKMAGDFFSHPAVPVAAAHYDRFLEITLSYAPQAAGLAARARLLHPVFQTKWCCIILNDFLPAAARRRRFADEAFDEVTRKHEQLAKARALYHCISQVY